MTNAQAVDYTWHLTSGSANFTDSSRWDPIGVPTAGDNVYINDAGSSTSTVLINSGDALQFATMNFSQGFINMSGGTVTASDRQHIYSSSGTGDTGYELQVSGGAVWTTTERFIIGEISGTADALVTGSGTTLASNGYFVIGNGAGTGKLTVSNGASIQKLTGGDKLIVGDGGVGRLTVNNNSTVSSAADVNLGWNGGDGLATLNDTASMTVASGKAAMIGFTNNGVGKLVLNGDSSASFGGSLDVARDQATGTLEIHDTASVTVANDLMIARNSAGNREGRVLMDGAGSELSVGGNLNVGYVDAGSLGYLTMSSTSSATVSGLFQVAHDNSTGTVSLSQNASLVANGTGNSNWGTGAGKAYVTLADNSSMSIAAAKTTIVDGNSSTAVVTVQDNAQLIFAGSVTLGHYNNANNSSATLNIGNGNGTALVQSSNLIMGRNDDFNNSPTSTVNLNAGGVLAANNIVKGGGGAEKKVINANGGTIKALSNQAEFFTNVGSVAGGTVTGHVPVNIQSGGLTFDTNGFAVGTANSFSGVGGLTKAGAGVLTLSGGGAYTGTTAVNAGTLLIKTTALTGGGAASLGAATLQINDTAGAFSQSLGALTLTGNATIDFNLNGNSALAFADSSANNWGSFTLTLSNFTVGSDTLRFGTTSDGLTGAQLSYLTLGVEGYTASLDVNGFVQFTAVPEPSTWSLLVGSGLVALVIARRRSAGRRQA